MENNLFILAKNIHEVSDSKIGAGKRVNYEVASGKAEAEELLQSHWNKQKNLGKKPSQIEDGKSISSSADYFIEEIDLRG